MCRVEELSKKLKGIRLILCIITESTVRAKSAGATKGDCLQGTACLTRAVLFHATITPRRECLLVMRRIAI
jgi:hypothetical protein